MRGTTYAISEIIWWMLAAGVIGGLIGWILRRWFAGGGRLKDVQAELDAKNTRFAQVSSDLGEYKLKVDGLVNELESRRNELTAAGETADELQGKLANVRGELATAGSKVKELEAQLAEAKGDLESAASQSRDLEAKLGSVSAEKDAEIARLGAAAAGIAGLESSVAERDARLAELEARAGEVAGELAATNNELADVRAAHAECAVAAEQTAGRIAALESAIAERDSRIAGIQADLDAAPGVDTVGALEAKIAALESSRSAAEAAARDLQARLTAAHEAQRKAVDLQSQLAAGAARIAELEGKLATMEAAAAEAADLEGFAAAEANVESIMASPPPMVTAPVTAPPPRTRFGTAGADHTDDLKVISGIGPKMEDLLNSVGIRSWEQLADFTPDDVAKVDAALTDFPGRIERDEWVEQARAIIANGHRPPSS